WSSDVCSSDLKPGDQLQEKSHVCACQQGLFHQVLSYVLLGVQILIFCIKCKLSHKCYKMQFSGFFLLIFCFSLLKYTYYYNYRSHISLQVVKLAKSAGVQILIFPTVAMTIFPQYASMCIFLIFLTRSEENTYE